MQDSTVFFTASRAYGMYESEYQTMASHWITMKMRTREALCLCGSKSHEHRGRFQGRGCLTAKATKSVMAIDTRTKTVAMILVGANILSSWLMGPIKKHVLAKEMTLPKLYKIPNPLMLAKNMATDPNMERNMPSRKHMMNPLILVDHDRVVLSITWKIGC